ncbi:hypothetical protein [Haliea sp. E17]|uniref:hypothetical protein n=1 Tax=Haliea sp. E17 TaxID=3401576 RepID=UPI003AAF1796
MAARLALAAPLLIIALAACWQATSLLRQDFSYAAAMTEVGFWGRADYRPAPAAIERTGRGIAALLQQAPANPEYHALQARYLAWRGYWAQDAEVRLRLDARALQAQYRAQQLRPAHRQGWQKVLEYASHTLDGAAAMAEASRRIAVLQPAA